MHPYDAPARHAHAKHTCDAITYATHARGRGRETGSGGGGAILSLAALAGSFAKEQLSLSKLRCQLTRQREPKGRGGRRKGTKAANTGTGENELR